jgi:hypothetical protein
MSNAARPVLPGITRQAAVDYVCRTCSGARVTRDAWADWDTKAQRWKLGAAFDFAYCHDCEDETKLVEVDLEARVPTGD